MEIISLRENPALLEQFLNYFVAHWGVEAVYRDCMTAALQSNSPLPQWFLLRNEQNETCGGIGLISNDFISRMDLYPWFCALFVEEAYRCQGWGGRLIARAEQAAQENGFHAIYCCTDHVNYYERYGYAYLGDGFHPWGESSRIYGKTW